MIRIPALTPAIAAGLLVACSAAGPAAAVSAPATDSPAAAFLKTIHQGNLAEIASGLDARHSATASCVERIGAILARDHTALDAAVKSLASKLHVTLPSVPSAAQLSQFAKVKRNAGTRAYDAGWLQMQAAGHQQVLALLDRVISSASPADLAAAARLARPLVAHHLVMVQACGAPAAVPATSAAPGPVKAGLGGTATGSTGIGVPLLAASTVLAASGAGWTLRRRRATVRR